MPVSDVGLRRSLSPRPESGTRCAFWNCNLELPMLPSPELVIATAQDWTGEDAFALTEAQARLRQIVLDGVRSPLTRRSYAKALEELFRFSAGRPSRASQTPLATRVGTHQSHRRLPMEWQAASTRPVQNPPGLQIGLNVLCWPFSHAAPGGRRWIQRQRFRRRDLRPWSAQVHAEQHQS